MIYGLKTTELQEGYVPLEAVAIIKCLDQNGQPTLVMETTDSLSSWEALGMLTAAARTMSDHLQDGFIEDFNEDEDGGEED